MVESILHGVQIRHEKDVTRWDGGTDASDKEGKEGDAKVQVGIQLGSLQPLLLFG